MSEKAQIDMPELTFNWVDFTLFGGLLGISILIGIYFGYFNKKQDNVAEYLLGGKTMKFFPISMSLVASHLSGISFLGLPTEVYYYGTQYAAFIFTSILNALITSYVYLPTFHKLQLTSSFEYLELRFAKSVRTLASFLYTVSLITYIPMVLYVPTLAFAQTTGVNLQAVGIVIGLVCIFYTTIGGLKAIVWTDTVQLLLTLGSLISIVVLGFMSAGSFPRILQIADEGGRLIFWNMDPSLFERNTFWSMVIGLTFTWVSELGVNQATMQRFLAVPTIMEARKSIVSMTIGLLIIKYVLMLVGLNMYALYHDCDPVEAHIVGKKDQIVPYYVMSVSNKFPGLPGLFLAGLVSAGLSTLSTTLNTCAGTIYEDFIDPWLPLSDKRESRAATIMKCLVVFLGILCICILFVMDKLGDIFQVTLSLTGITSGGLLGIFSLGMLVPWSTTLGVLVGGSVSLIVMSVIVIGAQWSIAQKKLVYEALPLSIQNCPNVEFFNKTTTTTMLPPTGDDVPFILFTLSFMYYTVFGTLMVVVVGIIVSFIFGTNDLSKANPDHFPWFIQRLLPPKTYKEVILQKDPMTVITDFETKEIKICD